MNDTSVWAGLLLIAMVNTIRFWLIPEAEMAFLVSAVFTLVIIVLMVTSILT